MKDFDTSDPPRYRFSLFGHRASGKSVYLLALGASRRTETDGSNAKFLRALASHGAADPASAPSAEEVEREYAEALAALKEGRLPSQTNTIHGNLRYAFSLLTPAAPQAADRGAAVRHLEISDHAGELINRLANEAEKATLLRSFLAERDGLVLVAEAPRPGDSLETRTKALAEVTELSSRLSQVLEDHALESLRCRTAVLLVTKWDRIHPFDGFQKDDESTSDFVARLSREEALHATLFEQWLETAEASEHRRLLNDLRTRFGPEAVQAYPVTAFGEAGRSQDPVTGDFVEVPARLPLATLNLVKPLRFLAERTDTIFRKALLQRLADDDPGGALNFLRLLEVFPSRTQSLPKWPEIRPRFGSDPELYKAVERTRQQRRKVRRLQMVSGGTTVALICFIVGFGYGLMNASQMRKKVESALATPALEHLIAADRALTSLDQRTPLLPSTWSERWILPDSEVDRLRGRLIEAECDRWNSVINIDSGSPDHQRIREFLDRTIDAPHCPELSTAVSRYETERSVREGLGQIDQLLNAYEFVPAIERIFAQARNPAMPSEMLGERLHTINERFDAWARQMELRPDSNEIVLRRLVDIMGALGTSPRQLADAALGLREQLEARRGPLELRRACDGFQILRQDARNLTAASGHWPRLDSIEALLARIGQWPERERSEFLHATAQLRRYVERLKQLEIRRVTTSGALPEAFRFPYAALLTVTVATMTSADSIDTRRPGEEQLEAVLENSSPLIVELGSYPQIEVELIERSRLSGSRVWAGNLGEGAPLNWDAMRGTGWEVDVNLRSDDVPETQGRIRITLVLGIPPVLPSRTAIPSACNP